MICSSHVAIGRSLGLGGDVVVVVVVLLLVPVLVRNCLPIFVRLATGQAPERRHL